MRKSTFVMALAASSALVAASAGTSFAGHATGNATHGATLHQGSSVAAAKVQPNGKAFKVYSQPVSKYTSKSCDIDLSKIADGSTVTTVKGCKTKVTLSSASLKESVPNGWASWGSPPDTESATPNVIWSNGATTLTVDLGTKVTTGGLEVEPDQFAVETTQVDFYAGPNGTGKLVGSITRDDTDGSGGAKLFGATAKKGFMSLVITNQAGDDFAFAQIRV